MRIAGRTRSSTMCSTEWRQLFDLLWIQMRKGSERAHIFKYQCTVSRITGVASEMVLLGSMSASGSYW